MELLRGRDGLPGRDGLAGPPGHPGLKGKEGQPGPKSGGTMYTRWGRSSCPTSTGAELVYSGYAGGSWYGHTGGGANYLCLPEDPQYCSDLRYRSGTQADRGLLYGAEYQHPTTSSHDHNVPCAVCRVPTRTTVLMMPAKCDCPSSWTREYYGYLMSERYTHQRSTFECVDRAMKHLPGGLGDTNGALFYTVEVRCGHGLPCPPYVDHKETNCVVCTM